MAEDGAVLVFTQYVAMARLLERHLAAAGVPHQFLHGGTPVRERDAMVARFQAGEAPVFLLSLKAGGTGLNLTRADHVIHLDRWWNPAVEDQATDRAYRIGQTRPVQVHRFITQGTIEEKIAELLARKRSLADSVLVARRDRADRAVRRRAPRPRGAAAMNTPRRPPPPLRSSGRRRGDPDEHPRGIGDHPPTAPCPPGRWVRHLVEQGGAPGGGGGRLRREGPPRRPAARPGGAVGAITVSEGGAVAAVSDGQDAFTVEVTVPVLDAADAAAFVELVAAESGRIGALLAGQLPHSFVEAVEEAGVELLPYGGELGSACSCDAWLDPCPHALAVLTQLAWLIQADPFVLIHLRGLARERVLRDLHRLVRPPAGEAPQDA